MKMHYDMISYYLKKSVDEILKSIVIAYSYAMTKILIITTNGVTG